MSWQLELRSPYSPETAVSLTKPCEHCGYEILRDLHAVHASVCKDMQLDVSTTDAVSDDAEGISQVNGAQHRVSRLGTLTSESLLLVVVNQENEST